MVDVHAPKVPLTVHLPAELIDELRLVAAEDRVTLDKVVMEACLDFTEPRGWERLYREEE